MADVVTRVAVLYPESKSRVSQVYASIIRGMARDNIELHRRSFVMDSSVDDIRQWLRDEKCNAVVFLGKKGLLFSRRFRIDIPIITGAHVGVLDNRSAVTLAADPKQLLHTLQKMKPSVQRVSVIYNPENSGWLISLAQVEARKMGIHLNAVKSNSMRASGAALKQILVQAETGRDAVWLLLDPIVPVKALLPELLKSAWQKDLVVFSGNPYHVKQGALFALYPNYSDMGRQLVDLVLLDIKRDSTVRHQVVRSLNSAINMRTAAHLGVNMKNIDTSPFSLIFPARQ